MSKILLFGGTRFFGKALVHRLIEEGHDITVATRGVTEDDFGNSVTRVIVDRENKQSIQNILLDTTFDIVFDNICYSPNDAKMVCELFAGKVGKYIFTSTMAVYDMGLDKKEINFDPYTYPVLEGDRHQFSYGEGKRLAEAVFFQQATFPVIAVRFPVVLGKDDYTKRLFFYCEKIINNTPISLVEGECSFILADEAARFLSWISGEDFSGPINACSQGTISLKEIIHHIEVVSGEQAIISEKGEAGPYNGYTNYTISNEVAIKLGFQFEILKEYVYPLLEEYVKELQATIK